MVMLRLDGLSHAYRNHVALSDVTLSLELGVTGLLGPNGAGKTTLMKIAATVLRIQQGQLSIDENLVADRPAAEEARKVIGYLPQRFEVMGFSSVQRNLEYAAWVTGLDGAAIGPAVAWALGVVGLTDRARSRARSLSGGMRQRLGIACAIVNRPRLLILDEPTVGLDPAQRRQLRQVLRVLGNDACVLVSTHLVEDLATIAGQALIMNGGRLVFSGSCEELAELGARQGDALSSPLESGYQAVLAAAA